VEYLGSARYDDDLAVYCRASRLGRSSMTYLFEIWREGPEPSDAPLVTAELVYVNADPASMKAAPLPAELRERVRAYERTAPLEG
jgi:acyl-CoA thioester hydrolase